MTYGGSDGIAQEGPFPPQPKLQGLPGSHFAEYFPHGLDILLRAPIMSTLEDLKKQNEALQGKGMILGSDKISHAQPLPRAPTPASYHWEIACFSD